MRCAVWVERGSVGDGQLWQSIWEEDFFYGRFI
jgi:hypothetical protein